MNDILFGNNNRAIIKKLANRCFQRNKLRNGIAVFAIFLTALLICTVFSIGGNYVNSWKLQQEQTRGTNGHAALNAPSAQQYEYLSVSEEIKDIPGLDAVYHYSCSDCFLLVASLTICKSYDEEIIASALLQSGFLLVRAAACHLPNRLQQALAFACSIHGQLPDHNAAQVLFGIACFFLYRADTVVIHRHAVVAHMVFFVCAGHGL